jgi:hypothetical protein
MVQDADSAVATGKMMTILEKQRLITAFRSGKQSVASLAKMFGVPRPTVDRIVKHKDVKTIMELHPLVAGESMRDAGLFAHPLPVSL